VNTPLNTVGRLALLALAGGAAGWSDTPADHTQVDVQVGDEEAYRQFWLHAIRAVRHFGYDLDRTDPARG